MDINLSLVFYLKKPKNYKSGPVPVYLRITVEGKRAEVSASRECEPGWWNASSGRATGTKEAVKALNAYIDGLQVKVYEGHRALMEYARFWMCC